MSVCGVRVCVWGHALESGSMSDGSYESGPSKLEVLRTSKALPLTTIQWGRAITKNSSSRSPDIPFHIGAWKQ
jgi:hypothetical protein